MASAELSMAVRKKKGTRGPANAALAQRTATLFDQFYQGRRQLAVAAQRLGQLLSAQRRLIRFLVDKVSRSASGNEHVQRSRN